MSAWIDADGQLREAWKYQPLYRSCRNCGESTSPLKMDEDGWCDGCSQGLSNLLGYDPVWSTELCAEMLVGYLLNLDGYDACLIQVMARNTGRHALNVLGRDEAERGAA